MFLSGAFSVKTAVEKTQNGVNYIRALGIEEGGDADLLNVTASGYPFVHEVLVACGRATLEGGKRYKLKVNHTFDAAEVEINGKRKPLVIVDECEITELVKAGENEIQIRLYPSTQLLYGPHHTKAAEVDTIAPWSFGYDDYSGMPPVFDDVTGVKAQALYGVSVVEME